MPQVPEKADSITTYLVALILGCMSFIDQYGNAILFILGIVIAFVRLYADILAVKINADKLKKLKEDD